MPKKKAAPKREKPQRKNGPKDNPSDNPQSGPATGAKGDNKAFSIVGVGASAGGLEAFEQLLSSLPGDVGMAFVLVPHLAPKHESIMTELLSKHSKMPIMEATEGTRVEINHVYVIPPSADIRVENATLYLSRIPDNRRMPIDHFFRSLADDQHSRAVGVVLSGTASDGTLGLQAIKAQGGITFAQDEKTAKYNAMPRNAIATGNVDFILSPDLIARELTRIARHAHVLHGVDAEAGVDVLDEHMQRIFGLLKAFSHVDFSFYKTGTIHRRIGRRMYVRKIESIEEYYRFLKANPEEIKALFHDVLINVTGFFREAEAFEVLKTTVFPTIIANKSANSPVRVWVPGCSTGEEAYSLAMSLVEFLGENAANTPVQVFATDVSESIIQKARLGIYGENISSDVSNERLRRFFHKVDEGYQIATTIRDMCVFAKQDITRDPPFSKLDFISCRNVMIYMGQVLQKRILPLFHYALNDGGALFLGSSETVGTFGELFATVDRKHKIYAKRPGPTRVNFDFVPHFRGDEEPMPIGELERHPPATGSDLQKVADQILLNRFAPASVVVNQSLDIVQFIGNTGPYLSPASGDASLNLLKMVKSGLHQELRVAFQKVKRDGRVRRDGLLVEHDGGFKTVNVEILPVNNLPGRERYHIVVFEDAGKKPAPGSATSKPAKQKQKEKSPRRTKEQGEMTRLTEELEATREYLQSIIEEQRTTNEELRSANEEIQSSNEELQSINEELETAKEELQSTNEELTTVNEEVQNRNDELTHLNNDLSNLISSVNIPIVMLGQDLRIRRFTPLAERVMNLIPSDIGRPITDIKPDFKVDDLQGVIRDVIETLKTQDMEVEDHSGRRYSMRIRPYRTADNKIDGVVIVLLDLPKLAKEKASEADQAR